MLQPGKGVSSDPMLDWQQTALPTLVHNTSSVDVVKAAIGTRHAALITRAGELYTWGYGQGEGGESLRGEGRKGPGAAGRVRGGCLGGGRGGKGLGLRAG